MTASNTAAVPDDVIDKAARAMAIHAGWDSWDTATDFTHTLSGNTPKDERDYWLDLAHIALSQPAAAPMSGWISVDERLPQVGVQVLTYSPPQRYDHPGDVRISFDCIDPNDDDHASWLNHNEHYEHYCCVAKPEGSTGPSERAPYTHWQPLPTAPDTEAAPVEQDAVREQLVAALSQLFGDIQPRLRRELDDDVKRNPGADDCSTSVPMTPKAWQAITAALAAAGVKL